MKKLFLLLSVCSLVVFGSCKRSYTCMCVYAAGSTNDTVYTSTSASTQTIAQSNCQALSGSITGGYTQTCTLK